MIVRFDITEDHIARAYPCDPFICPIAVALKAKGYSEVAVSIIDVVIRHQGIVYRGSLPDKLSMAVVEFDCNGQFKPQSARIIFEKVV